MNDKKRFPNERPEDVDKVLTDSSSVRCIRYIISLITDYTNFSALIYSVNSKDFKNFLERIAKSLELLSDYITEELEPEIEALSGDLTESYDTNKELHRENQRLKTENEYLRDDKFRVVMECTERDKEISRLKKLLNTSIKNTDIWKKSYFSAHTEREELREKLSNSEKMLKAAVSKIDELEYAKKKATKNSIYGFCACEIKHDINSAYPSKMIYADTDSVKIFHNGSNFCGNCRYCQTTVSGKYICTQHYVKEIDPDDSSCAKFKAPYEKPDHVCCENCTKKDDPDYCNYKCHLYPF